MRTSLGTNQCHLVALYCKVKAAPSALSHAGLSASLSQAHEGDFSRSGLLLPSRATSSSPMAVGSIAAKFHSQTSFYAEMATGTFHIHCAMVLSCPSCEGLCFRAAYMALPRPCSLPQGLSSIRRRVSFQPGSP